MPKSKKWSELPALASLLGSDGLVVVREIAGKLYSRATTVQGVVDLVTDLAGGIPTDEKGAANGVATLDGDGKLTSSERPSYTTAQVSESGNLYFTGARAIAAALTGFTSGAGSVSSSDSILTALQKIVGNLALKIASTEKGAANGVATLGADSKIPNSQLPALAITDTFVVDSQSEMLALSDAEKGDVAVRTDLNKSFILAAEPYSTLANWQELLTPTDAVQSVNGQTGSVTLTTSHVSEGSNQYFTAARAIAAALTGFSAGAGSVSSSDSILQALQKIVGNLALKATLADPSFTGSISFGNYKLHPSEYSAGNSGTSKTLDWTNGSAQLVTMTGNCTFGFSNGVAGGSYVVRILAGSGGFTIAGTNVTWLNSTGAAPAAPASGKVLLVNLYCLDGTNYYGSFAGDYAA